VAVEDAVRLRVAVVAGQRLERNLALVSLAQKHTKSAFSLSCGTGRGREPPAQQLECSPELAGRRRRARWLGRGVGAERLVDQLALDASRQQRPADSLVSPALELPLVLPEQTRIASVVDTALFSQHVQRPFHHLVIDALRLEVAADLCLRAVSTIQIAIRELERMLEPLIGVERAEPLRRASSSRRHRLDRFQGGLLALFDRLDQIAADTQRLIDLRLDLLG